MSVFGQLLITNVDSRTLGRVYCRQNNLCTQFTTTHHILRTGNDVSINLIHTHIMYINVFCQRM